MLNKKNKIIATLLILLIVGIFIMLFFIFNFSIQEIPFIFKLLYSQVTQSGKVGDCQYDPPPRDIPKALMEKSKKPADQILDIMPPMLEFFGNTFKTSIESGGFAATIKGFSENIWESEEDARNYFESNVKKNIKDIANLFRESSIATLDSFLNIAGLASTGIFGHEFRHLRGFQGPRASINLFSYKEKNLNLNANIVLNTVNDGTKKYFLENARFDFGATYILDAKKNGRLSIESSYYVECQPPSWEQVNTAKMVWNSEYKAPYFRYHIPTLVKIKLKDRILGVKTIIISGTVELDPWEKNWEKALTWRFGIKFRGGE
jgi:hypothetical protein